MTAAAGYSGTPLHQKLRPKDGQRVLISSVALVAALTAPVAAAGTDDGIRSALTGCWQLIPSAKLQELLKDGRQTYAHRRCFDGEVPGLSDWETCDGLDRMVGPTPVHCYDSIDSYDVSNGRLVITRSDSTFVMSCEVEIIDATLSFSDCAAWDPTAPGMTPIVVSGESYTRVQP